MSNADALTKPSRLAFNPEGESRPIAPHKPQPQSPAAGAAAEETTFRVVAWLLVIGLLSQKLSVFVLPKTPLQAVLILEYLFLGWCVLTERLRFDALRAILVGLFLLTALASTLANEPVVTSLIYLVVLYLPFCVQVPLSRANYMRLVEVYQRLALAIGAWCLIDWLFQFAGLPMPDFEMLIPRDWLFINYNYIQLLEWGSQWMKPNAFFFLEVSFVGQLLAMALVIELCLARRLTHVLFYLLTLVSTFSGTGFVLALAGLPFVLVKLRVRLALAAFAMVPLAGAVAYEIGVVDNALKRSEEFGKSGASANIRFTSQFEAIAGSFDKPVGDALLGIGAGRTPASATVGWSPITKILIEYGVIGAGLFLCLLLVSLFRRSTPTVIGYLFAIKFLFLNQGLLVPVIPFEMLILAAMLKLYDGHAPGIPPAAAVAARNRQTRS